MSQVFITSVALLLAACRSDATRSQDSGADCSRERAALAAKIRESASCVRDEDCTDYSALCLMEESGNCAGIFYISKAQMPAVETAAADYEAACLGRGCGAGGSCGLGPLPPTCVQGTCQGRPL